MSASAAGPSEPGSLLLAIARRLLSGHLVTAVVEPTISDLRIELAEAGAGRLHRLRARWRGYRAFWTLLLIAVCAPWILPVSPAGCRDSHGAVLLGVTAVLFALVIALNPVLGGVVAAVAITGSLCAVAMHVWYQRHPSELPTPTQRFWRSPQINFSSTDVAGNSGGFIFVVGTVVVVALGLPSVLCFLIAGTLAGCLVARGLVEWRQRHPQADLPERHIIGR